MIILNATECHITGVLGLVPDGPNRHSDDVLSVMGDATGIAHDIVEHVNGLENIGTICDEFEALGAIWYTRGHLGDISRPPRAHGPEEDLIADLTRMYGELNRAEYGEPSGRQPACNFDDDFREILRGAAKEIRRDYCNELERLSTFLRDAYHGMRLGAAKQQTKYSTTFHANRCFWNVYDAVQSCYRELEYEGQQFELHFDADSATARACEYFPPDELDW